MGDILTGTVEPTDSDCEWASDDEDEDDAIAEELKKKMNIGDGDDKTPGSDENAKGVPEFWLQIFRQVDSLSEMLQEHDEPIMRHLEDIKVKYSDPGKPMSFELEFLFSENEFFNNRSLSKVYQMRAEPDETDPLSFEGPEIGHFFRDRIIPRAVLYFTGEALEDDDDDYEEEEDEDGDDEDDDDDDDDDDEEEEGPRKGKKGEVKK